MIMMGTSGTPPQNTLVQIVDPPADRSERPVPSSSTNTPLPDTVHSPIILTHQLTLTVEYRLRYSLSHTGLEHEEKLRSKKQK
ncbi:uncharacterized protein G2W53_008763 [Senna tora]|uniref:Uncharacterized protein n=1 Tax=Senna tora TaxID=362788 RepID=A0A834WWQ6_9FABA|nr:uncharacterized protein G2W53_008763 [Senna tora]